MEASRYFIFERPTVDAKAFREVDKATALREVEEGDDFDLLVIEAAPKKFGGTEVAVLTDIAGKPTFHPDYNLVLTSDDTLIATALLTALQTVSEA